MVKGSTNISYQYLLLLV